MELQMLYVVIGVIKAKLLHMCVNFWSHQSKFKFEQKYIDNHSSQINRKKNQWIKVIYC